MTDHSESKIRIKASKPAKEMAGGFGPGGTNTRTGRTIFDLMVQKGIFPAGADAPERPVGTFLDVEGSKRYEIGRVIARGGMGIIYEARDVNLNRTVAMKVLPKEMPHPTDDMLRFIEEAQITSQLEHPNIVPLHELGLDVNGTVYYTMKYVRGMTLTEILIAIQHGKEQVIEQYPLVRLLNMFQKTCDGVAFAHSRGVIHRDLKPDNIMVGDYGEVQVMDWGLATILAAHAKAQPEEPAEEVPEAEMAEVQADNEPEPFDSGLKTITTVQTIPGRVMGSPGFMAPEQARADIANIGPRSDIYSLGAILYSILTLRPSVSVTDTVSALRRIVAGNLRPPVEFNQDAGAKFPHCPGGKIPEALSKIAMKAMSTDPAARYDSVMALQKEIEDFQEGRLWQLVLDEDFKGPDVMARWKVIGGQYELHDGELRVQNGEPQLVLLRRDLPGDVRIEFECSQEGNYLNDMGCFLNAVLTNNEREIWSSGYEFKCGAYDNSMIVLMRSDQKLWSQPASPIVRGKMFHVCAERVGARLKLTLNNEEIINILDPDPLTGTDRVAVGLLGWRADTRYRRVKVYSLGTPWKSDVIEMAERQLNKGRYQVAMGLFQEVIDSFPDAERMERARRGFDLASHRDEMMANLPSWRERLTRAWPGVNAQLRMANDGLSVEITNAGVTDLAPLAGMPLTTLYCSHNLITSLEPLRGMPLKTLNFTGNPVADIDPLRGMPLDTLLCENCRIESIAPLQGMPLTMLRCGGNRIASLKPLRGMKLTFLDFHDNRVTDLGPLHEMPLMSLNFGGNHVTSLEPLRDLKLNMIHCGGNPIADLEPLRGMKLDVLHLGNARVASLEPLRGMSIAILSAHANAITSLEPLAGMPIGALTCGGNLLTTLEPFVENPPEDFAFDCDTIPDAELIRARDSWRGKKKLAQLVHNIDVLLALRREDLKQLRELAREFEGRRYLFIPRFMAWSDAKTFCEKLGGHLVTITSQQEHDFVSSLFEGGCWCWIGMNTTEQGSAWVTGEPVTYTNFVDMTRERKMSPKVFSRRWYTDHVPHAHNCFMIEWES